MAKDNDIHAVKDYWERHARRDPMWAILSDPEKKDRKWTSREFFETGRREISILMFRLQSLKIEAPRTSALDFGCGIGRLTQALAEFFDRVAGVDVSETMIRLANKANRFPYRVRYVVNPNDHLKIFQDREFDFIYTNIVLQHLQPELILKYLEEFRRILRAGGLLIFQLPSHRRRDADARTAVKAMPDDAYASSIRLESIPPSRLNPSTEITLKVTVKNEGRGEWIRNDAAPIRLGNHWMSEDGMTMLIQDDGRADLPRVLAAGEECLVFLTVKTPPLEGNYRCEIDLVHEGIYWFKDKGASTLSFSLRVKSESAGATPADATPAASPDDLAAAPSAPQDDAVPDDICGDLPADADTPPDEFPMNGIPKAQVVDFFESGGDAVIRVEDDEHGGLEWAGYQYYVRKKSG